MTKEIENTEKTITYDVEVDSDEAMNKWQYNPESMIAFARLLVTFLFSAFAALGWALDYDLVLNLILSALGVVSITYSWWKNQNVTLGAQVAQKMLDEIKTGE